MGEIRTVEDLPRYSGWREALEEKQAYEQRRREIEAERERKARAVAEKQHAPVTNDWDAWYAAVDARIEQHFLSGKLGVGGALKGAIRDALGEIRQQLRGEFKHAIGEVRDASGAQLVEQSEKLREEFRVGIGRLPIAKTFDPDEVCYRGDVIIHDGSVFQALKDTGKAPAVDHPDWILLARAGRDAATLNFRGGFDAYKKYRRLDVVEYDGSGLVAIRDNPGIPGGDGWQLLSRSGRRGPVGERGPRGGKGEKGAKGDAPEITGWHIERASFRAFPVYSDGRMGPELNLRPLFEQYCEETS